MSCERCVAAVAGAGTVAVVVAAVSGEHIIAGRGAPLRTAGRLRDTPASAPPLLLLLSVAVVAVVAELVAVAVAVAVAVGWKAAGPGAR